MFRNKLIATTVLAGLVVVPAANAEEMTVNLGGRIQLDGALYDDDITDLGSGMEVRRARLFVDGDINEDWSYKAQYDFASSSDIKDLYIRYKGDIGQITIGQSKVPFGLEELTSSKYTTFMERSLPTTAFAPSRRLGVSWAKAINDWLLQGMVYGKEANQSINGDQGLGVAGRVSWTPVKTDDGLIHIGVDGAWMEPSSTTDKTARYRTRPESHVTSVRLVDISLTDVDSTTMYDLEFAGVWGGFSAQGEYIMTDVDQSLAGVSNPSFDGYYVQASWFPGGETRPYKNGAFGRVKANNAWEFAVRHSEVNLTDGTFVGGEEKNTTFGANYYVNPYLRFMANYILIDVTNGINGDEDPSVFQFRAAMDFK